MQSMSYGPEELRDFYNRSGSGHFFDKETMRFFASRLCSEFVRLSDTEALFLTSEKACFNDPKRVYTVRRAVIVPSESGLGSGKVRIDSVNEASRVSRSEAVRFMRQFKK